MRTADRTAGPGRTDQIAKYREGKMRLTITVVDILSGITILSEGITFGGSPWQLRLQARAR
jgi:hypothetical protein